MKHILLPFIALLTFVSCEEHTEEMVTLDGTFIGMFSRDDPRADFDISEVTLTFTNNQFEGTSSIPRYPAICEGSFQVNEDIITFTDSCVWTADFDWRYILSGDFAIKIDGSKLLLQRSYEEITDTYTLTKQ